jgi:hypothetical protein
LGIQPLLFIILFLTLFAYLAIWTWVVVQIWQSDPDAVPDVNSFAIYAGSALGGTLSGFFAFTLGIQRSMQATASAEQQPISPPQMALGLTIARGSRADVAFTLLTTLAIWFYAAVGVAALATVFFRPGSSPESVKAVASAFIGLVFALFNQVFQSQSQ